jgi:hypothetical protein
MSWPDPARRFEPAEDQALREELAGMLGLPAARTPAARVPAAHNFFDAEPTPELIALADKLRAEADRRRHTSRRRPAWMMAAAVLPFMLVLAGLGTWGSNHKRKAEEAQARAAQAEEEARNRSRELQRMTLESTKAEIDRDREERQGFRAVRQAANSSRGKGVKHPAGAELVIPVDHPLRAPALDAQRVKAQGQPQQ